GRAAAGRVGPAGEDGRVPQPVPRQLRHRAGPGRATLTLRLVARGGHLARLCLDSRGMAFGPLKNNLDLLLMGVLRSGPAHGYAIISALRERSAGDFEFAEGTIYPALHRLEQAGLVESSLKSVQGRRRR